MSDQPMTPAMVSAIGRELKRRVIEGESDEITPVVTLIAMAKAGRITQENIQTALNIIFEDKIKIIAVLIEAQKHISADLIDEIINEVRTTH